jgi:iron complex outermembrane receptor protein
MSRFRSNSRDRWIVSACALALGAWYSAPAQAATAQSDTASGASEVTEVIVTAERRATDIQKTPLAITAVPAEKLDKSFVNDIAGLNATVPSLEATKTSGFENIVTIRGIGSETPENDLTTVPGVSLFVDGVYLVNTISLSQSLFDIDHIEVLRGPQGALYGQSSIGGAINIVTKQPQLHVFSGEGDFSAGTYQLTRERAEINVPVGDTLAARFSIQRFDHEGFTTDVAIPGFREDDAHNTSIKAALLWQPVSNFSATLTGEWYRANEHGQAQKNINDPEPGPWQIFQDYPSKSDLTTQLYHLNLQYDFPWFSIRSVSAYQGLNSVLQEDSTRSAISLIGAYDDVAGWNTRVHSYTEEFDILSRPDSRLEWIIGGFALKQSSRQFVAEFEGTTTTPNPDVAILPDIETNPPGNLAYGNDSLVERRSESVFAQATYHFLPTLRLTLGARYNHDNYSDRSLNFSGFGINTVSNRTSDNVGTWRAEVDYDLMPESMIYASAARGYKPAGVNGSNDHFFIPAVFAPETNTAFEVGSKNFLFDRSLRLNLAAFYYLYKNMQYIADDPIPFNSAISNIPSIHIYGVEAEATYVGMNSHLRIDGNLALENGRVQGTYLTLDSTVTNAVESQPYPSPCAFGGAFYNPACWAAVVAAAKNIGGNTPPAMPKVSGSIDAAYTFDAPYGALTPRVEFIYRGSEWARIFNEPALDKIKSYGVTNLNLEFVPTGSRFRLAVTATNVFDVAGVNSRYTDPFGTGQTSQQFIPPREVIFSVGYSF